MTTLNIPVSAGSDDCYGDTNGNFYLYNNGFGLFFGVYNSPVIPTTVGIRFLNVNIPGNVIISAAYITLVAYWASYRGTYYRLYANQSSTPATFSTWADLNGRAKTTEYADWNIPAWGAGGTYNSVDISNVIQELVDDYGGVTNIAIIAVNNGTGQNDDRAAYSYDFGANVAPVLHIEYSPVAPTVTTQAVTDIEKTTISANGNITSTGGENATIRGFCYKEGNSGDPNIDDDNEVHEDGSFTAGAYELSITGLTAYTSYRVRAYATNGGGTSYGATVDVRTLISATYVEILTADRALALDNTTAFTPDADYEPATKKYVDDQVGGTAHGDMETATYDTDIDGVVDKAEGVVTGTTLPGTASDGELFGKTDSKELYIWFD